MKRLTLYRFDSETDANWQRRIDEAFCRVLEFCPELRHTKARPPELTAFNRIIGGEFSTLDVNTLVDYGDKVRERIQAQYARVPFRDAPWADAVRQAADNLSHVLTDFVVWFRNSKGGPDA